MQKTKISIIATFSGIFLLLNFSCVPFNNIRYFTDINEIAEPVANPKEHKIIHPFNNLYIKVLSTDEQTTRIFNYSDNAQSGAPTSLLGYVVDENGNVNFPFVGKINVGGMTTDQAGEEIQESLKQYISNASIIVRFLDNKISVLGEVENQGVYSFAEEKLNIYEALSFSGGLTQYGDRRNVILIRQEGDKIVHHKLDLSNSSIANKSLYYIIPNDVIIVEPLKAIRRSYNSIDFQTIVSSLTAFLSLFIIFRTTGAN